jgi:hypothetical protein
MDGHPDANGPNVNLLDLGFLDPDAPDDALRRALHLALAAIEGMPTRPDARNDDARPDVVRREPTVLPTDG